MSLPAPNTYPPDLVNQLRIFSVLAQYRLAINRAMAVPISFQNIPPIWRLPLYWVDDDAVPVPNEGIIAGEIIAHRCWRVGEDGETLFSMAVDACWRPGEVMQGDVDAAGVHAFKDFERMADYATWWTDSFRVGGTVKLWGDVIEHEHGYRAQFARIRSLDSIHCCARAIIAGQDRVFGYCETRRDRIDRDDLLATLREKYRV